MHRFALVALAALLCAGCAMKADLESLEQSMLSEMQQIRVDQETVLAQLSLAFDSLDAAQGRRELTGRGEFDRRIERLEDQIAELLTLTAQNNQLLNDLYNNRSSLGVDRGPRPGVIGVPATGGDPVATEFYAAAQAQYRQGNYETARGAFQEFLAQYPTHELAPDAQFFLAETYASTGDQAMALVEYQRVMEHFPDSQRAPTSLYKRGLIEEQRGNLALARSLFRQIEAGYPNSPEAEAAREKLRRLDS
jgi:tol-pal system protein YbgF